MGVVKIQSGHPACLGAATPHGAETVAITARQGAAVVAHGRRDWSACWMVALVMTVIGTAVAIIGGAAIAAPGGTAAMAAEHSFIEPPANAPAAVGQSYCSNVGDKAADARFAWQAAKIKEMSAELDVRIAKLEGRIGELKSWVEKREKFMELGNEALVKIFSSMRPDAASEQLTKINDLTAAAIVMKLKPRDASAILNDMDPQRAARLMSTIAGAAQATASKGGS